MEPTHRTDRPVMPEGYGVPESDEVACTTPQQIGIKVAREHEEWVIEIFGGLDGPEQARLFDSLARLKKSLPADTSSANRKRPRPKTS